MVKLSFAYMTNRGNPAFQWFADSLYNQTEGKDVEVLVVDLLSDYEPDKRREYFEGCVDGRFPIRVIPPKPCPVQGRFRKSREDMFAAANARNTAFVHADSSYIVCIDDLSVLSPDYVANARHAAENGYVMLGAYRKAKDLVVENGIIQSHGEIIPDSRWGIGSPKGIVPTHGGLLFGCSFGVPIQATIDTNGFDEYCDGLGAEDTDFGTRLARAGYKIFYNRNALSTESWDLHFQPGTFSRKNRKVKSTGEDADWFMVNRLREQPRRITTLGQWTNIREFREKIKRGEELDGDSLPDIDWATQLPYSELPIKERTED